MSIASMEPFLLPGPDAPADRRRSQSEQLGVEANFKSSLAVAGDLAIGPDTSILGKLNAALDAIIAGQRPERTEQSYQVFSIATLGQIGPPYLVTLPPGMWTLDRLMLLTDLAGGTGPAVISISGLFPIPFILSAAANGLASFSPRWRVPQQLALTLTVMTAATAGNATMMYSFREDKSNG
jgi:hypothetical protein